MKEFYILSLNHSRPGEPLTWWRPDRAGYTYDLDKAGRYSEQEIDGKTHYGNPDTTLVVPCELADSYATRVSFDNIATLALAVLGAEARISAVTVDDRDWEGKGECGECGREFGRNAGFKITKKVG